jgi:hypothetical protein
MTNNITEGDKKTDDEKNVAADEAPAAAVGVKRSSTSSDDDDKIDSSDDSTSSSPSPPTTKKAKIAMPPAVASSLLDVEKYELDPPDEKAEREDDEEEEETDEMIATKITTPNLILFSLHPLIKESPLQKLCEDYGTVKDMTVRSAFASRYGHVEFETVDEARRCYKALNGAKLLHKAILVQPGAK